jgi:PIN domain nuclease of toxin-antitoxin system
VGEYVLDASALLALLNDEAGASRVAAVITGAAISAVNVSEVLSKLVDAGMPAEDARSVLEWLRLDIVPFDEEMAYTAGALRSQSRGLGLSLGDRCCLALGISRRCTILTAERSWARLKVGIDIEVVR